jgi:hypothetical protein
MSPTAKGAFTLSSEFDQVRERIDYLREHPDLRLLEADILTLAAQMSQQSHRLAEIYADERVARAKDFLAQRQQEPRTSRPESPRRSRPAARSCAGTPRSSSEESSWPSQLQQLDEQLQQVLPALGYSFDSDGDKDQQPRWPSPTARHEPPDNIAPWRASRGGVIPRGRDRRSLDPERLRNVAPWPKSGNGAANRSSPAPPAGQPLQMVGRCEPRSWNTLS